MLCVERQGDVAVWTIDRPEAKNALDHATLAALARALREAAEDRTLRAAVITGAGDAFVSGGDLRELRDKSSRDDAEHLSDAGYEVTSAIAALPFPVIAAIGGPAIGGGAELLVACDLRVADARARIAFKQVRMGVTTAWGTVPRLVTLVGAGAAARLLFCAQEIGATECKALGLVDEVTENGQARATALAWAADIARGAPRAVAETKRLLREAQVAARDVRSLERQAFVDTWSSPDHRDAVEAYFERRPARFQPL
ncbi:MAG: enoyl-CoA hydratase/isomerase family protein [Labilithrix sp.]|nr:enoyl-CoA hydratase/isomerase family protein [Labilithrix sp.]